MPVTTVWTYALAALLFALVALGERRRARAIGDAFAVRTALVVALSATALWALAMAGIDPAAVATRITEAVRNLAWLAYMLVLLRHQSRGAAPRAVIAMYAVLMMLVVVGAGLALVEDMLRPAAVAREIAGVRVGLRLMVTLGALLLIHQLHATIARDRARGGLRLAALAVAALWAIDALLIGGAYSIGHWPPSLIAARGVALVAIAPVFAIAAQRDGDWTLHLSRTMTFQWVLAGALCGYVLLMTAGTAAIGALGGGETRIVQTAFVLGTSVALLTIASTPWLRAWTKVVVAKHFYRHRYDYRVEWMCFTDTIGVPGAGAEPIDTRVIKAVADLTDSPAGLLLTPDGTGMDVAAAWNWIGGETGHAGSALLRHLSTTRRIVEIDAVRSGRAEADDARAIPSWMIEHADAWAIVPLVHFDRLAGAILLARPPIDRALDWEDFDLLGIAGRQVASYLAEDRAHDALADAQRFEEFNRRFAFIMHDLKNLVSQLMLVARNAERHAENPAFRADMVATLKDSADRMNGLLARLSQHHARGGEPVRPVPLLALATTMATARRAQHPIVAVGDADAVALADPAALEIIVAHLIQNAIEASAPAERVTLAVSRDAGTAAIDVIDRGCGMSAAFVRDRLFRPFVSSKDGGFGIGAFEARQLAEAMGGSVTVASREGEGTRFRVQLPVAQGVAIGAAA